MLRIALFLAPFALGVVIGVWLKSRGATRRFWSILIVTSMASLFPALRIGERFTGTRFADALSARLANALGCSEIGCGSVGGAFYVISIACLLFSAGLLAGSAFVRARNAAST